MVSIIVDVVGINKELSCGCWVGRTYVNIHLLIQAICYKQVMCHSDAMWLHGMALAIVVVSDLLWTVRIVKRMRQQQANATTHT
jgi:hypothetical protein